MTKGTVVAFGNFDLHGARSWVIRTGLEDHDFQITLCRTEAPGFFRKYRDLRRRWKEHQAGASAIYVVFLGHYLMPLAWYLGKRAGIPVIFDAFLSLYDTEVHDRARVSRFSPYAWVLWCSDWLGCRLADVVVLDTEEHKEYFVKTYGVDPRKILVLPVGCRTDLFNSEGGHSARWQAGMPAPNQKNDESFQVEFHGTYIPLQGADIIMRAAEELQARGEDVQFTFIGTQMERSLMPLAKEWSLMNVRFHHSVSIEELAPFIHRADVCLGIFGTSAKADRVIPNKAYEVIACGKPLITGDTSAARRMFKDRENVLLSPPGDPHALAENILTLQKDGTLRSHIAAGGLALSQVQFQPATIVTPLIRWLGV